MHQTLNEIVESNAYTYPAEDAIICGERRISFGELATMSHRGAQALRNAGVQPGDRIAYMAKNDWQFVTLSLAAMEAGVALVPINWRLSAREVTLLLTHSESVLAVVGEEFIDDFDALRNEVPLVREVLVAGVGNETYLSFEDWLAQAPSAQPLGETIDPDAVCYQMYTAGTTGTPKGAMITNHNVSVALPISATSWGISLRSTPMISSPVFHIAGIAYALAGLWNAGTLIIVRDPTPENLLVAIETHKVTSSLLVPAMILMLLNTPRSWEADLSSLELITYGAAPISQDVLSRAIKLFQCDFTQAYGLTETTGVVVELPPEVHKAGYAHPERLRAAGIPMEGVELRIVAPTGEVLPDGEAGEVWIRSEQNLIGYWADEVATNDALPGDGWFRSGDVGHLSEGFLFINDRLKDVILSGGENVYSAEVENILMGHSQVADCAVIAVPSERWGEAVKAIVVLREGVALEEAAIIEFCRESLAGFKCPASVNFIDALPRNAAGKILKRELRSKHWSGRTRMAG